MFDDSISYDIENNGFVPQQNDFEATLSPESVPEFDESNIQPSISMFGDDFFYTDFKPTDYFDSQKSNREVQKESKIMLKPKSIVSNERSRIFYPFESYQSTETCVQFLREWTREKFGVVEQRLDIFKVIS